MSYSYTKLFSSITESTIWCEPSGTRLVWITLLAKVDRHGRVFASIPGLARLSNVTLQECEIALATLQSPDKYSRTSDNEGRRLEVIDGGWRLLNYAKYRDQQHDEDERERKRRVAAERRERDKQAKENGSEEVAEVAGSSEQSRHADVASDATAYADKSQKQEKPKHAQQAARFAEFWLVYPNKKGRKAALRHWRTAKLDPLADQLIAHVRRMLAEDDDWKRGFVPHGSTYINGERWTDVPMGPRLAAAVGNAGPARTPEGPSPRKTETPESRAAEAEEGRRQIERLQREAGYAA